MLGLGRRLIAICAVATIAGCGGAQPTASQAAAPTSMVSTSPNAEPTTPPSPTASRAGPLAFSSEFYGFKIDLPPDWTARAAITPWVTGGLEGQCPTDWDCFSHEADDRTLAIAAFDVAKATTLDDWQAAMHRTAPSFCKDSSAHETTLDGERGLMWTAACESESLNAIKLAALRGKRAYMFLFVSPATQSPEANRATFDAVMSTFRFADRPTPT